MAWNYTLPSYKLQFEVGRKDSALAAIRIHLRHGVPIPDWAAAGFLEALDEVWGYRVASWDDVFGKRLKKGEHLAAVRKRKLKINPVPTSRPQVPKNSAAKGTDTACDPTRTLTIPRVPEESDERMKARVALRPTVQAALTAFALVRGDFGEVTLDELVNELTAQCGAIQDGHLARSEDILTAQAHTLDAIFNKLARASYMNIWKDLNAGERLFRLALKAQSQCRATLETLTAIKNPPMVIARQANVTSGPQQINNAAPVAREIEPEPNKLLEQSDGERLDGGAASQAITGNTDMAAVGAVNRSQD